MAYAALVSLEKTTHLILNHHKYSDFVGGRKQITSIHELLIPFLEKFPEKSNPLEEKIRALAYEAEDLIEYSMSDKSGMSWWRFLLSRVKFQRRLKRVRDEMGSIYAEMKDGRFNDLPATNSSSRVAASGESRNSKWATGKNDVVIGLDKDLIDIKGRLCGESSKLEVIPIVGMGGIGKTTLARSAYDDQLILEHFHIRAFFQVSQDYSTKEILSNLLASIKLLEEQTIGETNESEIAENVYKSLKGRRYLVVMDDIWSTRAWDAVRNIFPNDNMGSRIMLTTRDSDVASYASSGSPLHEMKIMDENQSWDLLKQKVFTNSKDLEFPELEDIGKEIARGCSGLPLAVVLVAGILSTITRTRASWEEIAKNVISVIDGQIDQILSLSYTLLPHHLRPCFLFMGGFPEDHNIHISRLSRLWVAEGFMKHQNGCKSLEEEAEEYLEDLVKRSLVLITSRKSDGKIKSCSLHDLVREMCIRKAQEEKFLLTDGYALPEMRKDGRRISMGHSRLYDIWSPTVRTILSFHTILDCSSLAFLVNFRLLRILDVMHDNSSKLPGQVFDLFHLRYLALAFGDKIPAAISKLVNLQTLIIRRSTYSTFPPFLPKEIWQMQQLRHLVFPRRCILRCPSYRQTIPLENLQTLSGIASFVGSERILEMIPNLKKLSLFYFINRKRHHLHNLENLHQLEKLKITWSFSWLGRYPAFPRTLKKLTLVGGQLPWKDMSIVGSLPNLQVLKLKNYACYGDAWETRDEEFPQLEFLLIEQSYLENWITENLPLPRLKCLMLHDCPNLREIPECIGEIPTLQVIEVYIENESLVNSATQIQEDQLNYGNDALQVRCIETTPFKFVASVADQVTVLSS
ncbi:hypothetical protein ACS0TY_023171 [Phlomoides rotata]